MSFLTYSGMIAKLDKIEIVIKSKTQWRGGVVLADGEAPEARRAT